MEKNDSNTKDSSRETLNDRKEMRKIINEIMSNVRKYKRNDTDVLKDKIKQLLTNSKKDVTTIKDEEKIL